MRSSCLVSSFRNFAVCVFCVWSKPTARSAAATTPKAGPYKVVSVTPQQTINDATFEAFRKQMNEAASALPSNVGSAGAQRSPLRYVKDASGWKIGGYIGGGDTQ
jgi:hypothetical protein